MFGHLFIYGFKALLRTKEVIFWTLLFPFGLTIFMYLGLSNIFNTTEKFNVIPVAVVQEKENTVMEQFLSAVSEKGEDQMLEVTKTDKNNAEKLLKDGKVKGVIIESDDTTLRVAKNGMEATILQMVLGQFKQYETTMQDVATTHPEKIQQAALSMSQQVQYYAEKESGNGNQDNTVNYFYAVFAMACLFASFSGCGKICQIQANVSPLGLRRSVSPTHKMKSILAEFAVCELIQFFLAVVLFIFMKYILNIQLGDKVGAILILLFCATSMGNMLGICIGSIAKLGEGMKIGILISLSLGMCVLSDLMISGIRDAIEHHAPIVNQINPASLVVDSFYALNVYDSYDRFIGNILQMLAITAILGIISFFMLRRNKYASL